MATSIPVINADAPQMIATEKTVAVAAPEIDETATLRDLFDMALAAHRSLLPAVRAISPHRSSGVTVGINAADAPLAEGILALWCTVHGVGLTTDEYDYHDVHWRVVRARVGGDSIIEIVAHWPLSAPELVPAEAKRCGVDEDQMWDRSEP